MGSLLLLIPILGNDLVGVKVGLVLPAGIVQGKVGPLDVVLVLSIWQLVMIEDALDNE